MRCRCDSERKFETQQSSPEHLFHISSHHTKCYSWSLSHIQLVLVLDLASLLINPSEHYLNLFSCNLELVDCSLICWMTIYSAVLVSTPAWCPFLGFFYAGLPCRHPSFHITAPGSDSTFDPAPQILNSCQWPAEHPAFAYVCAPLQVSV